MARLLACAFDRVRHPDPQGSRSHRAREPGEADALQHPAFSPDGAMLVAGTQEDGLRLWSDWKKVPTSRVLRHTGAQSQPSFSPDGTRIVASDSDPTGASVWHVESGQRRSMRTLLTSGRCQFWQGGEAIVVETLGDKSSFGRTSYQGRGLSCSCGFKGKSKSTKNNQRRVERAC
ncbi:MAG: WD40 repeat domain-containing protein [Myxococcales bacterium]|nr:WD40 repeat domain-containing protein [Myxococcales bacterium]